MLFHRPIRRCAIACSLLIALALTLKFALPEIGATVGDWIAGAADNRVSEAIASFSAALSEGESLKEAVEVFYESWQNFTTG